MNMPWRKNPKEDEDTTSDDWRLADIIKAETGDSDWFEEPDLEPVSLSDQEAMDLVLGGGMVGGITAIDGEN